MADSPHIGTGTQPVIGESAHSPGAQAAGGGIPPGHGSGTPASQASPAATASETSGPTGQYRFHHAVAVRFHDLDAMGHAHHTLPLIYLEEARAAYWREVAGRETVAGIDYVMGEVTVRFQRRIRYPARLDVALRVSRFGSKSFDMEFEIRGPDGLPVTTGRTVQVMFDYRAGVSMRVPDELRQRIEAYEGGG